MRERPPVRLFLSILIMCGAVACKRDNPLFCEAASDCPGGMVCDVPARECIGALGDGGLPQPDAGSCVEDDDCTGFRDPICQRDVGVCRGCESAVECEDKDLAAPLCRDDGACVQCALHRDCSGTSPICADATGTCGACANNNECEQLGAGTDLCAPDGACAECLDHGDCASTVCDRASRTCVAEANVIYVDDAGGVDVAGCGTLLTACKTIDAGIAEVAGARKWVRIAAGSYLESLDVSSRDANLVGPDVELGGARVNAPVVRADNGADLFIDGLRIHSAGASAGNLDADGVQCEDPGTTVTLSRVTLDNNAVSGIDADPGCAVAVDDVIVRDNLGVGIILFDASMTAERLAVINNATGGLNAIDSGVHIINSVFAHNGRENESTTGGVRIVDNDTPVMPKVFSFNTVAFNDSATGAASGVDCDASMTATNILIRTGKGGPNVQGTCQWSHAAVPGGVTGGAAIVDAECDLVDPDGGDYHLGPGTDCQDAGDPNSTVAADIDGDPRPRGAGFDIGADERP